MAGLRTEFEFTLPKGYVAPDGVLHREGLMRLATARDEIEPLRDRSIEGPDDPYLTVLVLARVVTRLGTLATVTPREIEGLFAADLAFLQDLYGIINFGDQADVAALQASVLPDEPEPVPVADDAQASEPSGSDDGEGLGEDTSEPPVRATRRGRAQIEEVTPAGST